MDTRYDHHVICADEFDILFLILRLFLIMLFICSFLFPFAVALLSSLHLLGLRTSSRNLRSFVTIQFKYDHRTTISRINIIEPELRKNQLAGCNLNDYTVY